MNKLAREAVVSHQPGDTISQTLARNLIRVRTAAGWSQVDLAKRSGVSNAAISRVEAGLSDPTLSTVRSLTLALGVSIDEMLVGV